MFRQLWKTICTAVLVVGLLLCFFALVEVIRAYEVLRDLHPALGWLFLLLLLAGVVGLAARYATTVSRRPSILLPPVRSDQQEMSLSEWRAYAGYLARVMKRLSQNKRLSDEQREALTRGMDELRGMVRSRPDEKTLASAVKTAEAHLVQPAVDSLDKQAEQEVRRCVRDVMLGVTLSPWRSVDLMVVLYRNVGMVSQVIAIYNARPRFKEQLLVFRDVLTIVATVNYLNYGSKLSQNLLASVPGLGRFTDDVAQGAGAGLLTSVAGHSTRERCREFRGWNRVEAQRTLVRTLGQFMLDVKGMMLDQVLPHLHLDVMDRMKQGVAAAIDETAKAADSLVRKPITAAGRGISYTGNAVTSTVRHGGQFAWRGVAAVGRGTGRVLDRAIGMSGRGMAGAGRIAQRGFRKGVEAVRPSKRGKREEEEK